MKKVLLINGPNLNMLGTRETDIYGKKTLDDILKTVDGLATSLSLSLTSIQSNHEGQIVDSIQAAGNDGIDFILINPGAYTHTSIAIRDAFLSVDIPFIEIHLSNVHAREPFRRQSYLSDIAKGIVAGFGPYSYELALLAATRHLAT